MGLELTRGPGTDALSEGLKHHGCLLLTVLWRMGASPCGCHGKDPKRRAGKEKDTKSASSASENGEDPTSISASLHQ